MDLTIATDIEIEAPPPPPPIAQPNKPFSLSNGAPRKRSNHHPSHPPPPAAVVLSYRECLKNHAARLGGYAVDGCGEFMPSPAANSADPTSLKCVACGCHRNFHRREEDPTTTTTYFLDFHRHPPLPPPTTIQSSPLSLSPSPPPYYSLVPHTMLALSTAAGVPEDNPTTTNNRAETPTVPAKRIGRKRFRTKFSREQKEKMRWFSEKVGWKIQRIDEGLVEGFCNEVGVGKGVLKVWMHNNKQTSAKRSETAAAVDKAIDRNGRVLSSFDNTCRHNNSPTVTSNSHQQSEDNNGVHLSASSSGSPSSSS